ncbi:MAG: hypothetical protein GXP47_03495, partial [Acidobacteria bacterium]|nr:hypothetical protein [Acidobacteriota bacterium]
VAVGASGSWKSADGVHWAPLTDEHRVCMDLGALAKITDGGLFGFGEQDTVVRLDGSSWNVVHTAGEPDLVRVASSGSRWVAVGSAWLPGMAPVLVSEDGQAWRQVPVPGGVCEITDVVWTGERFLAAAGTVLLSSSDGLLWRSVPAPGGATITALAMNGGGIMATGGAPGGPGGAVWWSEDGESWSRVATVGAGLRRIACNADGLCVAGGWHGLVASGRRSGAWHESYLAAEHPGRSFSGVAWNGRRWVVAGSPGVYSSTDGTTWTRQGSRRVAVDAAWSGDAFLALPETGWRSSLFQPWHGSWTCTLEVSPDGLAWGDRMLTNLRADHVTTVSRVPWLLGRRGLLAARQGPPPGLGEPIAHTYLVPAAAHLDGLNGTRWRSDLTVALDVWGASGADLFLLRSGKAAAEASRRRVMLDETGVLHLGDVVRETFLVTGEAGAVLIRSSKPLAGWSRTFTAAADGRGSYGQLVPVVDTDALRPVQDLLGLREGPGFRTDLGLVNAEATDLTARVEVRDTLGRLLASREIGLAPYSYTMLTRFLSLVAQGPVENAWVRVIFPATTERPNPRCLAFASVIDNTSGDPMTVLAARASERPLVVPVAVHLPGYNQTLWRTDLEVVNTGEQEARFRVEYRPADGAAPVVTSPELELAPGAAARYPDVVASLLGTGDKGTLLVAPSQGAVAVMSRTYTTSGHGSYGQVVAAVPLTGVASGEGRWIGLPVEDDPASGFRTSVGIVNLSNAPAHLSWSGSGNPALSEWTVPARSLRQLDHALARELWAPRELSLSFVALDSPVPPLLAYVSIVDNVTGDPLFYPSYPALW